MRSFLAVLVLMVAGPPSASALDWSVYATNPGTIEPPLAFHQLAITTVDSVRIAAWFVPAQDSAGSVLPGRHPGLLVLPREGESLPDRLPLIGAMSRRGFSVLAVDQRGVGAGDPFPEDPRALVQREYLTDASAALDILWRRPEVDTLRTAVIGESRGAVLALALAGRRPELRAAVAIGVPRNWKTYLESLRKLEPAQEYFVPKGWERRDDPDRVIKRFNGSIFFITGIMDLKTPAWMARELYEKYPRPKDLWIVEDAGHSGNRTPERVAPDAFYDRVSEFLAHAYRERLPRGWPNE